MEIEELPSVARSASLSTENAIEVKDVWERYRLYHDRSNNLKETLTRFKRATYEEFWALKGLTFQVKRGDVFGVIGVNGSGKSTLLKCIARTINPTKGAVKINGKVSALLEVGAGFHPDLTGRENVFINGAMLGMSRREIKRRFDEIVAFAELEQFIDMPVRSYSSGMYMRLGFSVAVHVDPDILLIDEVLAVGDQEFQTRCRDKIDEFREKGKTIFLVSHNLDEVKRICKSAVWLESGEMKSIGAVDDVVDAYMASVHARQEQAIEEEMKKAQGSEIRVGSKEAEITSFKILDDADEAHSIIKAGQRIRARIEYSTHRRIDEPVIGFAIHRSDGVLCTETNTKQDSLPIDFIEGKGAVECTIEDILLAPGTYFLSPYIYDNSLLAPFDRHEKNYEVRIFSDDHADGEAVFSIPSSWSFVAGDSIDIPRR